MDVCISEELKIRHPEYGPLLVGVDYHFSGAAKDVLEDGFSQITIRWVQRPTLDGGFEDVTDYEPTDIAERAVDAFVDRYVYAEKE